MSNDSSPSTFRPLNPTLYAALEQRFRSVMLANEGCGIEKLTVQDVLRPGKFHSQIVSAGEYYRVCCPYCGDSRHRLWINHQFGQVGADGFPQLWLAHCYNEQCIDSYDRRKDLETKIFGFRNREQRMRPVQIARGAIVPQTLGPVRLPGGVISVDRLPINHPAATYLRDARRHNLQYLAETFGVGFCHEADPEYRAAHSRIIIPIMQDGVLVGWQARFVGDVNWKVANTAKYWGRPGMPKRLILYNFDSAKAWPFVVVVEGVTSVWRIGGPAVALLGKTMTSQQQTIIQDTWSGKPVFLILDPDARAEMEGIVADMQRLGRVHIVPIYLPAGTDPDNYDHAVLVNMIRAHARQHGFELPEW